MTLEQYLREKATPYRGGRMLGRISVSEGAEATGMKPYQVVMAIRLMEYDKTLESMCIGGLDNQTAFYMVAA